VINYPKPTVFLFNVTFYIWVLITWFLNYGHKYCYLHTDFAFKFILVQLSINFHAICV